MKAIEVRAALELGRRLSALEPEARPEVHSPRDVFHLVGSEMARLDQEHLRVVLLNTKNRVLGVREVYRGTLNSSAVRVGELFREAIRESAASLIVVHNHPSGDPSPSPEDVRITADAVAAGTPAGHRGARPRGDRAAGPGPGGLRLAQGAPPGLRMSGVPPRRSTAERPTGGAA